MPPTYFVVFHRPGPAWVKGTGFRDQPGIGNHVAHMRALFGRGVMVMGGPFLDDSGGMMVLEAADAQAARELAEADPAVAAGLLSIEIKPWMVPMARPFTPASGG